MRFSPAAMALSLALAITASAGFSQSAEYSVDPRSTALLDKGYAAQQQGDFDTATGLYESALAVDPGNRAAFIALAQVARVQQLPGKAIRLYREALELNPNDLTALSGQGEALIQRGAVEKARRNLARIKALCTGSCPEEAQLLAALEKQKAPLLSAEAVAPKPQVTAAEQR